MSVPRDPVERVRALTEREPRFHAESYLFTLDALTFALEENRKSGHSGHISPRELMLQLRTFARRQFGYLARSVFREWGVNGTEDFGEIVFLLAEAELLSKHDSDRLEDFANVYDFGEAFETLQDLAV